MAYSDDGDLLYAYSPFFEITRDAKRMLRVVDEGNFGVAARRFVECTDNTAPRYQNKRKTIPNILYR